MNPENGQRRVCVFLATRGNYAKLRSTMQAVREHQDLELSVILGGALVLPEYSDLLNNIRQDFSIDEYVHFMVSGDTPTTIATSSGLCTINIAQAYNRLEPDIAVIVADRFESLAASQAAVCQNIHIAHLEGGEVTGSIDERIRHAITKLSHIHFVSNKEAQNRVIRMGEHSENVHVVGNPSHDQFSNIDLLDTSSLEDYLLKNVRGKVPDLNKEFVVVSQHPVATDYCNTENHIEQTLEALKKLGMPAVWILPNIDTSSKIICDKVELWNNNAFHEPICIVSGMPIVEYAMLIYNASCLIGNSSSGLRESSILGVPVVNIGQRQQGRTRAENIVDVDNDAKQIMQAIRSQISHGSYPSSTIYKEEKSGEKIADILLKQFPSLNKVITY